jgi:hypothetical protein
MQRVYILSACNTELPIQSISWRIIVVQIKEKLKTGLDQLVSFIDELKN